LTLYTFVPDSVNKSVCYGDCATYWPPVPGNMSAGPGVTGKIGTITRTDGTTQATYDGHPLYTYIGDHSPGQDGGNHINLPGGFPHRGLPPLPGFLPVPGDGQDQGHARRRAAQQQAALGLDAARAGQAPALRRAALAGVGVRGARRRRPMG